MEKAHARRDLAWMLLFLSGLLLPLGVGMGVSSTGMAAPWRVAAVLATLTATDMPLVVAGVTGRGPIGVVQPWRWAAYLPWLGIRVALLLTVAFLAGTG